MLPAAIKVGLAGEVDDQYYNRSVYRIENTVGLFRRVAAKASKPLGSILKAHDGDSLGFFLRWDSLEQSLIAAGYSLAEDKTP